MSLSVLAEKFTMTSPLPSGSEASVETRFAFLAAKQAEAAAALAGIERTGYVSADALASEAALQKKVEANAPYWAALGVASYVSPDLGLKLDAKSLRDWVLLQYDKASLGVPCFVPNMARQIVASGRLTEEQMIGDWKRRMWTYQMLIEGQKKGAYNQIKAGAFNGLGVVDPVTGFLIAMTIAIVLIAVICAIAFVVSEQQKTTTMNAHYKDLVNQVCSANPGSAECIAAVKNATDPSLSKSGAGDVMQTAVKYGALALGAIMLVNVLLNRMGAK